MFHVCIQMHKLEHTSCTDLQANCNKVVVKPISECVRNSQLLSEVWNKLLSSSNKINDADRLATGCSNKTKTGCSYNKLLRYLIATNCFVQTISDLFEQLVASLLASSILLEYDNNLLQTYTCQQVGRSSANTSC